MSYKIPIFLSYPKPPVGRRLAWWLFGIASFAMSKLKARLLPCIFRNRKDTMLCIFSVSE
jgi:hypothetical protein